MLKLMGSILILGGGFLAAWQQRALRRGRRNMLSDMVAALRYMVSEIQMTRTPLPILLESAAEHCGGEAANFFSGIADALGQGESLSDCWRQAVGELPFSRELGRVIENLGYSMQGNEEEVCRAISIVIYELVKYAEEWDNQRLEREKRAAALWMSGAALLVILLI